MITRRALISSALTVPAVLRAQRGERPNVLVVVLDDLGCADLGYLGASDMRTPHFDALARGGVVCEQWYANAPVCAPSRASILSGRHPHRAGVPGNGGVLRPSMPTLASVAKSAGYRTAAIGKWHLGYGPTTRPNAHAFDYFYGFLSGCVDFYSHRYYWGDPRRVNYHDLWRNNDEVFDNGIYLTERIADEAVGFIERNRREPFLGYVAFNAPHYPMHAPDKYMKRFEGLGRERQTYNAMVSAVDDGLGRITTALRSNGLIENTLIWFVGDNGATTEKRAGLDQQYATAGSNGRFRGFKFSLFDGGMHVPSIVHWPARIKAGAVVREVGQSMDILPTVCAATGLKTPDGLNGSNVLPMLTEGARTPHSELLWQTGDPKGGQTAIRRGKWKLVINGRTHEGRDGGNQPLTGDDALWLSDLDADPGETRNLRKENPKLVDELATVLGRWAESMAAENP